jgi:hypothetical protein
VYLLIGFRGFNQNALLFFLFVDNFGVHLNVI